MFRFLISSSAIFLSAAIASAHFVFVVPEKDAHQASVILSEDLQTDNDVDISILSGLKLDCANVKTLPLKKGEHAFTIDLPGAGTRDVHGAVELDVEQHGKGKPFLLAYYPKTILGDAFDPATKLGSAAPVELIVLGDPGKFKFQMLADNKAVLAAEINFILPDGSHQKITTDSQGQTPLFTTGGRYGAWSRHFETASGERNGKKFDEIHRYATLVVDIPPAVVTALPQMLEAASSFGAVVCGEYLYVYGGHVVDTHSYDTSSVSGHFSRLNLADPQRWESLPGGPALQGLNLAAWNGKVYRAGGMNPLNAPGKPSDVHSVAEVASFDPITSQWTQLPALPKPRSSHDVVVVGDQLIVVGGWTLTGDPDDAHWLNTATSLDLSAAKPEWKSIKQPFQRRAFTAASYHKKVYVIGGFSTESEPTKKVNIYDPAKDQWMTGPELPGKNMNGFGAAACVMNDTLYVSVADGNLYRLNQAGQAWESVARTTPRIVHRIAPDGSQIVVLGGAVAKKQSNLVEAVQLPAEK